MDIAEAFNQIEYLIMQRKWDEILTFAKDACERLAGINTVTAIMAINTSAYERQLKEGLQAALQRLKEKKYKAMYFEYDLDNDWNSNFFLHKKYNTRDKEDDEWASEWKETLDGPGFEAFGAVYATGNDKTDEDIGISILLIARTVLTFANTYYFLEKEFNPDAIPVCMAFHDQDPIWRICEKRGKAKNAVVLRKPKDYPPWSDTERIVPLFEPRFGNLSVLSPEGLASACEKGKWGFVNREGETVILFSYDHAMPFSEEVAVVRVGDKYAYVNASGQSVSPPRFEKANPFWNGIATANWEGKWGIIDKGGNCIQKPTYDDVRLPRDLNSITSENDAMCAVRMGTKWGYINQEGELAVPPAFECEWPGWFSEGLAGIAVKDRFGYIDTTGRFVLEYKDLGILQCHGSDFLNVRVEEFREGRGLIYYDEVGLPGFFVDRQGRFIARGSGCSSFSEGLAYMGIPGTDRGSLIDREGNVVLKDGKRKFRQPDGNTVERNITLFFRSLFREGLLSGVYDKKNDMYCLMDHSWGILVASDYMLGDVSNGVAQIIGRKGKYGYISRTGKMLLEPRYEYTHDFQADYGIVRDQNGLSAFAALAKVK